MIKKVLRTSSATKVTLKVPAGKYRVELFGNVGRPIARARGEWHTVRGDEEAGPTSLRSESIR